MFKKRHQSTGSWSSFDSETSIHNECNTFLESGKKILRRAINGLLPSFVHTRSRSVSSKQHRLHPTSYLDGIRGVASFIVFMGHYTEENLGWYTEPYGLYEDGAPSSPLQLPFLRVIYSARPMVHIFFIISGIVLAYKPITQIHFGQYSSLAGTVSSSVFRRAMRLFLPSIITLLFMAVAVWTGISDDRYAAQFLYFSHQMVHWVFSCWWLLKNSWGIKDVSFPTQPYNPALWTIPVEFSQSMILFVVLIGLSRCQIRKRLMILAGIMTFCFFQGQLYTVEFLGGMFMAEMIILNDSQSLPQYSLNEKAEVRNGPTIRERAMPAFWILNVVSGLYIASWTNEHVDEIWGLRFLDSHTPLPYEGQKMWFCIGAFQIVIACTQLESLQRPFNTDIAQYLGNISYTLYLTHNMCLTALEPRVSPYLDARFGKDTSTGRHLSWIIGFLLYLPIILWVADIFWRAVDIPSVKFARWIEGKCIVVDDPKMI